MPFDLTFQTFYGDSRGRRLPRQQFFFTPECLDSRLEGVPVQFSGVSSDFEG